MNVASADKEAKAAVSLTDPSSWSMGWMCILVPNAVMLFGHYKGKTLHIVNAVLRSPLGVHGLFAVPFIGVAMEKSFYDTALSLQGIDPNKLREDRKHEGFPSGGHMLPSFSMVSIRERPIEWRDLVPGAFLKKTEAE